MTRNCPQVIIIAITHTKWLFMVFDSAKSQASTLFNISSYTQFTMPHRVLRNGSKIFSLIYKAIIVKNKLSTVQLSKTAIILAPVIIDSPVEHIAYGANSAQCFHYIHIIMAGSIGTGEG